MDVTYKRGLYAAIGKSMLGRYAVYVANLGSLVLLARLYSPSQFGTVAAVAVLYLFFQLIAEAGLGPAIINLRSLSAIDRDGLFGLTALTGGALGTLFFLLSPVLAEFYKLPAIQTVVPFIAIAIMFSSLTIVPNALLLRDQAFFRIANAGLLAELASTFVSALLSLYIDPLRALAVKTSVSAAVLFGALYYFSSNTEYGRPRLGGKLSAIKPMLTFSSYQLGFNFLNYFSRNLDNILVGRVLGMSALGVYDKAYQLMRYPLMLLTYAMTPAIQPVIRDHASSKARVEQIHRAFAFRLSLLGAFTGLFIFLLSGQIVHVILGDKWTSVVDVVRVLALAVPVQTVLSSSGPFFQGMNRPGLLMLSGLLSTFVLVLAIIDGIASGSLIQLSWAIVIAFHINFFQAYYLMYSKMFDLAVSTFLVKMLPAGAIVGVTALLCIARVHAH